MRALVTTLKVANYVEFTWGRTKFQKVVGLSEKERSDIKGDGTSLLTMLPTYLPLRGDRTLCKSAVSSFFFIVDGRVKKKNDETGVLIVVILISKCKLRISSAKITLIQIYLMAQLPSQFFILVITSLFLFLFYFSVFESI